MKYYILNTDNGSVTEMNFESEVQLTQWLEINPNFESRGEAKGTLTTRHVRMDNDFAGQGSQNGTDLGNKRHTF